MTRYYIYIDAGEVIDQSTIFYRVAVGASKAGMRDAQFLQEYADHHNHYFKLRDDTTVDFIDKVRRSLDLDALPIIAISARALVRSYKNGTRVPLNSETLHNRHQVRVQLSLDYRLSSRAAAADKGHVKRY